MLTRMLMLAAGALAACGQIRGAGWEADIQEFERQDALAAPPRDAFLFIGSSSIRKWTSLAQDFPKVAVLNRGFGGSQLSDVNAYVDRIVVPYHPKMILLYCGDNDIASGHKSPQAVAEEFREFVARVRRALPHTPIAYLSMKPAPSTWETHGERMRAGNQLIREYIRTDPSLAYVDVFTPMLNAQGKPRPDIFEPDNEHLNAAGYALWVEIVQPFVK